MLDSVAGSTNYIKLPQRSEHVLARTHEQVGGQLAQRGDGDRVVGGGRLQKHGLETARDSVASGELRGEGRAERVWKEIAESGCV